MNTSTLVVLSGGMDSTTLAYLAATEGPVVAVSFDYGQRHRIELEYAATTAREIGAEHVVVPMAWLAPMIAGRSALVTDDVPVPEGHYAADTMAATVVPNRNAIMLNVAAGIAIARGMDRVGTGVHAGDHFVYPDCRPEFIALTNEALRVGNAGFAVEDFHLWAPFVNISKTDIAILGDELSVRWLDTWSCYVGGDAHCGKCGTCVERREAFRDAGVDDPTFYNDPDFAWTVL
jgi:7-cyano-7-deazaguanine synthase